MNILTCCPYCEGELKIKEVECQSCKTQIKGHFNTNRFHLFNHEDLLFIEIFLKNEGNIKLMEKDLGISYPTVKHRLKSIVKTLGYQEQDNPSEHRLNILNELSRGAINTKTAMKKLQELK